MLTCRVTLNRIKPPSSFGSLRPTTKYKFSKSNSHVYCQDDFKSQQATVKCHNPKAHQTAQVFRYTHQVVISRVTLNRNKLSSSFKFLRHTQKYTLSIANIQFATSGMDFTSQQATVKFQVLKAYQKPSFLTND